MSEWDAGWYDRVALIGGLHAMHDAGIRAVDALEQLRASADYITEHYRGEEEDVD